MTSQDSLSQFIDVLKVAMEQPQWAATTLTEVGTSASGAHFLGGILPDGTAISLTVSLTP